MALTDYTSYAEVRAVLGVSATELPDSVLAQPQWDSLLTLDLEDVSTNLPAKYAYMVEMYAEVFAEPADGLLKNERRFYELTRLYASYSTARTLLTSLPLFAVKDLTDGRASFSRGIGDFAEVRDAVLGMCTTLKSKLSIAYLKIDSTATLYTSNTQSFTVSTGIAISPITNS